jgi:hypothetical protein
LFELASDDDAMEEDATGLDEDTDYEETLVAEDDLVKRTTSIWKDYRPKLTSDLALVAYLCSPIPQIIEHTKDHNNLTPQVRLAVDRLIERLVFLRSSIPQR